MGIVGLAAAAGASGLSTLLAAARWLRVSQREHYVPGYATRFAMRWWRSTPLNAGLLVLGMVGIAGSLLEPLLLIVPLLVAAVGPVGLPLRGRTGLLAWTPRLMRLATLAGLFLLALVAVGIAAGLAPLALASAPLLVPALIDAACLVARPVEKARAATFVARASQKLQEISPHVVGITGSYGKTSTKNLVAHLLGGAYSVVASPGNFNNQLGLARTVNDHLSPGTDVLVAEMGTYGKGEIAEMCSWIRPEVAVITAVGPVHLERFGTAEAVLQAKAEIFGTASIAVLNCDDVLLRDLARELSNTLRVVRCSAVDASADAFVQPGVDRHLLYAVGKSLGEVASNHAPTNLACAVGVALAMKIPSEVLAARLDGLPVSEHRGFVGRNARQVTVIDDTYNSNPAGAARAVQLLERSASKGSRRAVVTPGMVELGRLQAGANEDFAKNASQCCTDFIVLSRTNRKALLRGAAGGPARVMTFRNLKEATAWVKKELGPGDAVLYENDLPDHFP